MFRLNESEQPSSADPVAYERSLQPTQARMSDDMREPATFEVARLNGQSITIPYAAAKTPGGTLKQIRMKVGLPVCNSYYQADEITVFMTEISDALIAAGAAEEV